MANPFSTRAANLTGPATDMVLVTPSDTEDLADVAIALYAEGAGSVAFAPVGAPGAIRQVSMAANSFLPVGVARVRATGTTATGLHALILI